MIRVKLREAMRAAERRSGTRVTYAHLARTTGLSRATLEALGSRPTYNTRLGTINKLCQALGCELTDLLTHKRDAKASPAKARR